SQMPLVPLIITPRLEGAITLYGSRFLTGEVGGSVTHQCFYSIIPANKYDRKYWCRLAGNGVCYTIISTTGYISKAHAGRVSLEDIPQKGTFHTSSMKLRIQKGRWWGGLEHNKSLCFF
uniref:Immunoglobulin V-set domain-containing protein n=1 Tax=Buteo japonicus TaxID=224669 RepID=A0A8B9Z0B0_9AVES